MAISPKFFVVAGLILMVSGVLSFFVRPRGKETGLQKFINLATIRATFFVLVGLLAVLVGTGVIPVLPVLN